MDVFIVQACDPRCCFLSGVLILGWHPDVAAILVDMSSTVHGLWGSVGLVRYLVNSMEGLDCLCHYLFDIAVISHHITFLACKFGPVLPDDLAIEIIVVASLPLHV